MAQKYKPQLPIVEGKYARVKMLSNFTLRLTTILLPHESGTGVCRRWAALTLEGEAESKVVEISGAQFANVGSFKGWLRKHFPAARWSGSQIEFARLTGDLYNNYMDAKGKP